MIPDWFQTAIDQSNKRKGIQILLDKIMDWYYSYDLESLDNFLSGLEKKDFAFISNLLMVNLLCDTLSAAHMLPSRLKVYNLIYSELEQRDQSVEKILKGLKENSFSVIKEHNQIFGGLLGGPTILEE